jgi:hypothetical protein
VFPRPPRCILVRVAGIAGTGKLLDALRFIRALSRMEPARLKSPSEKG